MLIHLLLWLHFVGVGLGMGTGVALSQVGPRLIAAPADQRALLWSLEKVFDRIGLIGLSLLLVTGPLLLKFKFGGATSLGGWFMAKMAMAALLIIGVGVHHWAAARFEKGDQGASRWMLVGGRTAGISVVLALLFAAVTFG